MSSINFKEFPIFRDIKHEKTSYVDIREDFANVIYMNVCGIRAHSLAMRIYRSDGVLELSDDEVKIVVDAANKYCLPAFIDSLNLQINCDVVQNNIQTP